jgi:phosphatidylglycerophosphate synthase
MPLPGILDCYSFSSNNWLCKFEAECNFPCFLAASTLYTVFWVPITILPIFFYARLYCKARKMQKSMANLGASAKVIRKSEWKATFTFFLLFMTVFAMTVPSVAISIAISSIYSFTEPPPAVYTLVLFSSCVLYFVIITDPIVIMRNHDVKEVLAEIKEAAFRKWHSSRD